MTRQDLILPDFHLDCRDWIVRTEADGLIPESLETLPVLAVLTTTVIEDERLHFADVVWSVGLLDEALGEPESSRPDPAAPLIYPMDVDFQTGQARYVLAGRENPLVLVAELSAEAPCHQEIRERYLRLIRSFRWAGSLPVGR